MMFAIKMLLALFLSGAIFLFTLYRLLGFQFRLTYKKTILSIVLSFCISTPVHAVHHSYMGLSEHLWFDNLGIVVFAVLLACAAAGLMLPLPRRAVRRLFLGRRAAAPAPRAISGYSRPAPQAVRTSRPAGQAVAYTQAALQTEPFDYAGYPAVGFRAR